MPLFEVEATIVEPVFHKLYSYIFDMENMRYSAAENDRPVPNAIFIVNFDKVWFAFWWFPTLLLKYRDYLFYVFIWILTFLVSINAEIFSRIHVYHLFYR